MFHSIFGGNRCEADVYKGQVGEEEVHGGVELGVWADSQDDEQVSKHSNQVHGEKKTQIWEVAILVSLKIPEDEIRKPLLGFLVPFGEGDCQESGKVTWLIFSQMGSTHMGELLSFIFFHPKMF